MWRLSLPQNPLATPTLENFVQHPHISTYSGFHTESRDGFTWDRLCRFSGVSQNANNRCPHCRECWGSRCARSSHLVLHAVCLVAHTQFISNLERAESLLWKEPVLAQIHFCAVWSRSCVTLTSSWCFAPMSMAVGFFDSHFMRYDLIDCQSWSIDRSPQVGLYGMRAGPV